MKKLLFGFAILLTGLNSCTVYTPAQQTTYKETPPNDVSYQQFYDDLSPYGQWIDYPGYGYVWAPSGIRGFKPYASNGYWVYADIGWTWVSGYKWGWAPFHYGRWFFDSMYGWVWVPGNEWAPAWVNWRSGSDYYGWSPMAPEMRTGYSNYGYTQPAKSWCFVPQQYVTSRNVNNYYVNESNNITIINHTTVINTVDHSRTNVYTGPNATRRMYDGGPDPREVERVSRTTVNPVVTRESNRPTSEPLNNGQLNLFRPRVNETPSTTTQRSAPARVAPFHGNAPQPITGNNNNTDNRNNRMGGNGNGSTPEPVNRGNEDPNRHNNNGNGQPVNNNPSPAGQQRENRHNENTETVITPVDNRNPQQQHSTVPQQPVNNHPANPGQLPAPQPATHPQPVRTPIMKPVTPPANNPNMSHPQQGKPASAQVVRPTSARPGSDTKKEEHQTQQQPAERHQ